MDNFRDPRYPSAAETQSEKTKRRVAAAARTNYKSDLEAVLEDLSGCEARSDDAVRGRLMQSAYLLEQMARELRAEAKLLK